MASEKRAAPVGAAREREACGCSLRACGLIAGADAPTTTPAPSPRLSVADEQDAFVESFNAIGDWLLQYDLLLTMYAQLPEFPVCERKDADLIEGCVNRLWVTCTLDEKSQVRIRMASEALIVGGIAAVVVGLFDGRFPEEVLEANLNFVERTALRRELTSERKGGMKLLEKKIKGFAQGVSS